jgi:hypothetical protein
VGTIKANATFILALLAFLQSLAAASGVYYLLYVREDPLGKGLSRYDFSTPASALKSGIQMEADHDLKAALEFERKTQKKDFQEILNTLEVKKEAEWGGRKILFVSFKRDGVTVFATRAFEKHADSGYWVKADVMLPSVRQNNQELAEAMDRWEKTGELEPKSAEKVAETGTIGTAPMRTETMKMTTAKTTSTFRVLETKATETRFETKKADFK